MKALRIEEKVQGDFAKRLDEIEERSADDDPQARTALLETRDRLLAERDRVLVAELAKDGIKLPDDELLNLEPVTLRISQSAAERTKAVNELVKKEPPRRTVTGSFRPH